jgi:precorrin-4/cobalt-precorrin-4 C11-methyltransferase
MVYFIGAGPGALGLITVRGMEILKKADVVIYAGSLVNPEFISFTKDGCKVYNSAGMTLEQVAAAIISAEKEKLTTARLHTGDPSIYGAIREQTDILDRRGIQYEIVPGVSSFCGAAAAIHAEYTLPGVSQTVIITRMPGRTPVPPKEELAKLASHGASMVVFLSAGLLAELSEELIKGGYPPVTPAAIVYKATWPDEKIVHTTVLGLSSAAKENSIDKTALILVGGFLGEGHERSKLYDPAFSHGFRKAEI